MAAVSGKSSFSIYVTPSNDIAPSATAVHGLRIAYDDRGNKCLSKNGALLASSSTEEVFNTFLTYLDSNLHHCVLIRHNANVFDMPRLMYQLSLCENELGRALEMPLYFGASLPSLRKETWLPKLKTLGSIYQDVTGKTFSAHDALEDSTALQVIMEDKCLKSCLSKTCDNGIHMI